jgi:SNF2-related domain/Helicase conserved C-terminal domain/Restriction endonuclease
MTTGRRDGCFGFCCVPLRRSLSVVRNLQLSDDAIRKQFARAPQLYLKEALHDRYNDNAIEHLFIETEQYSERVVDIGLWAPPVLPWIIRDPNDWLPERFGVRVGDKYVPVAAEDLPILRQAVETALERGEPKVTFNGEELPATRDTLDALSNLIGVVRPTASAAPSDPPPQEEEKPHKHVLVVGENFEQIDFTRELKPRLAYGGWEIPVLVKTPLKPHQRAGITWLLRTWTKGYPGVLLADDMGLGKTFQLLIFFAWLREKMGDPPVSRRAPLLVVAPTGLLKNWEDEHDMHLHGPGLGQLCRAYGSHLGRLKTQRFRDIETGMPALDDAAMRQCDWVLTTYETLRDYHFSFAKIRFACAALDEMQKVKNPASLLARAAKTINSEFIVGLTGTPIENRLEDLWAIMDILSPGRLGDLKSFSATYKPQESASLERLRAMLLDETGDEPAPVLRRLKADHLHGLPEKHVHVRRRKMPEAQAKVYAEVVTRAKSDDAGRMLEILHHLRGISLHPVWPQTSTINSPDAYISQSARLAETFDILDEINKRREKALIFLESLDMQDQLALIIKKRYGLQKMPMQINGELSGDKRKKAVDSFQRGKSGFDVMILSPKAGGVGLTLTAANHVIHLSRWWNPAVEDQCTDRIYRIGQDQPVNVYYPMAVHPDYGDASFDEVLNGLLERKRSLGRRMLVPPVNLKEDEAWFVEHLTAKANAHIDPADLDEIDRMEPQQFERWALSRMAPLGYASDRTPHSHDGGADGVMMHRRTKHRAIVQCKLRQNETQCCGDGPIDDLLRARAAYGSGATTLVALTNAADFPDRAKRRARDYGVILIARGALREWPVGCL